jgi:hypothetical protein
VEYGRPILRRYPPIPRRRSVGVNIDILLAFRETDRERERERETVKRHSTPCYLYSLEQHLLPEPPRCSYSVFKHTSHHRVYIRSISVMLSRIWMNVDGVWIDNSIYWPLTHTQLETTSNYGATANLHNSQITTAPAKPFTVSLPAVTWQRLRTVGILQLPRSRSSRLATISQLMYNILARKTQKHPVSSVAYVTVVAGTCLPSRCPETGMVYPSIPDRCIATVLHGTIYIGL